MVTRATDIFLRLSIIAAALFSPRDAAAQMTHYNNFLAGERAAGLGGAFTAVADDPTAVHYNPAGLGYIKKSSVSASGTAYKLSRTVYKNAYGTNDFVYEGSGVMPTFLGQVKPLGSGEWVAGYGVYTSDSDTVDLEASGAKVTEIMIDTIYTKVILERSLSVFAGSLARRLSDTLSVGTTVGYYRYVGKVQQYFDFRWGPVTGRTASGKPVFLNLVASNYVNGASHGMQFALGGLWRPTNELSAGLTVKVHARLADKARQSQKSRYILTYEDDTTVPPADLLPGVPELTTSLSREDTNEEGEFIKYLPANATLGLAWQLTEAQLLSLDVQHHLAPPRAKGASFGGEAVTNSALGYEWLIAKTYPLRAGLFTNLDARPKVTSANTVDEHVDMVGMTLAGGMKLEDVSVSLTLSHQMGKGRARLLSINSEGPIREADAKVSAAVISVATGT